MNFLTGLLLMYLPTEGQAFAALVVLMEDRKLRSFYHRSMALLQVQLWQLSRLISPALNTHLETMGVVPMLYGASWLMTAFSADFPIAFSARIMDVLLGDQCECALLKVAVAVMKVVEPRLLEMNDLEDVLGYLKIEVPAWEDDELHAVLTAAFTKPWTSRQLSILRSTEDAETVAQAMDRVMTAMSEQASGVPGDDDEGGDDGELPADGRVAVTVPRIKPPPQPNTTCSSSFAPSPACGTPIGGGPMGTGSMGGAGMLASTGGSPSMPIGISSGGSFRQQHAGAGSIAGSVGGSVGGGEAGMLSGMSSVGGSLTQWAIPSIHPEAQANPAIQAFRRAHLPSLAATAGAPVARAAGGRSILAGQAATAAVAASAASGTTPTDSLNLSPPQTQASAMEDGPAVASTAGLLQPAEKVILSGSLLHLHPDQPSLLRATTGEEWSELNAARQQWRTPSRSTPGGMRQNNTDGGGDEHNSTQDGAVAAGTPSVWRAVLPGPGPASAVGSSGASSAAGSLGGAPPASDSAAAPAPSQPIPVPSGGPARALSAMSAFANASGPAAAAAGLVLAPPKPPLPPRQASFDRAPPGGCASAFSRLSVVTEDPPSVLMGPTAPAPSPRGSMDIHVLGRAGSHHIDIGEHGGQLLGTSTAGAAGEGGFLAGGGAAAGMGASVFATGMGGSAPSCNGDCASGTASATTGGALLSPSGISGAVSPHTGVSPHVLLPSTWSHQSQGASAGASFIHSAGGGGGGTLGGGSDSPTAGATAGVGYAPLGATAAMAGAAAMLGVASAASASATGSLLYDGEAAAAAAAAAAGDAAALFTGLPDGAAADSQPTPTGTGSTAGGLLPLAPPPPPQVPLGSAPPAAAGERNPNTDLGTDIGCDILRMLTRVDASNANAAYDTCAVLGESMYADSPNKEDQPKEEQNLVKSGSEHSLRHLPSSSALDRMAAQDLARAQEEAERMRQELEAQLQQQRASEVSRSGAASVPNLSTAGTVQADGAAAADGAAVGGADGSAGDGAATANGESVSGGHTLSMNAAAAAVPVNENEVVLKRPALYVDGIPMFDPKTLMCDSQQEAQVMFTPLVSPGASSYAGGALEPQSTLTGVTAPPSASVSMSGVAAPAAAAGGADGEADGEEDEEVDDAAYDLAEPSDDEDDDEEAGTGLLADEDDDEDDRPFGSRQRAMAAAATAAAAAAARAAPAMLSSIAMAPAVAEPAGPATAGAAAAQRSDGAGAGPGGAPGQAGEWVDWSQAPPIQTAPPVTLPMTGPVREVVPASESHEDSPAAEAPAPAGEGAAGQSEPSAVFATTGAPHPERMLPEDSSHEPPHGMAPAAAQAYGLLPAVSNLSSLAAPLPRAISFATTDGGNTPSASLTVGPNRSGGFNWMQLRCDSMATSEVDSRVGSSRWAAGFATGLNTGDAVDSDSEGTPRHGDGGLGHIMGQPPGPPAPSLQHLHCSSMPGHAGPPDSGGESPLALTNSGPMHPSSAHPFGQPGLHGHGHGHGHSGVHGHLHLQQQHSSGSFGRSGGSGDYSGHGGIPASGGVVKRVTSRLGMSGSILAAGGIAEEEGEGEDDGPPPPSGPLSASKDSSRKELFFRDGSAAEGEEAPVTATDSSRPNGGTAAAASAAAAARASEDAEGGGVASPASGAVTAEGASTGDTTTTPDGAGGMGPMRHASSGLGEGDEAARAGSTGDGGGSGNAGEGPSPFSRTALSPSLAHHIISAYLRCEQHEQQQEKKELEERLMAQEQQQQQADADAEADGAGGADTPAMPDFAAAYASNAGDASPKALSGSMAGVAAGALSALEQQPPPPQLHAEEPSLASHGFSLPAVPMSPPAVLSPTLADGSRATASADAAGSGSSGGSAFAAFQQPPPVKALTPFAMSMEDPNMCRISAELLQSMPPPPAALQPSTPTPPVSIPGAGGSGAVAGGGGAGGRAAGFRSRTISGGGDGGGDEAGGDVTLTASGIGALGGSGLISALHSGGAGVSGSVVLRGLGSHDFAGGTGSILNASMGGGVVSGPGCASGTSFMGGSGAPGSALMQALHGVSFRAVSSSCGGSGAPGTSGGGAAPVSLLLPPPPPPQVPLCAATAGRADAASASALAAAVSAVSSTSAAAAPSSLLDSGAHTVVCVSAATSSSVPTSTISATGASATSTDRGPAPPAWTATFDEPAGGRAADVAPATAACESPPFPGRDSAGLTSAGIRTPDARTPAPDMARGMSLEAAGQ
ncbi:hypothetical protein HYH02_005521 [Chlamydomonas schloesseri]|uniref:Rab-GAP TBC domain-containing protein n=1 Tax=Chlamydomonas schloesseri TaxID=2026947 RepID=A0A835WKI4_9CHLO|nr:hypothetical protein HYH02_005521 [Chlamydomonas schloesseri]|eukprot:KAG2449368.1 hypothetical protein HYH02_005521 [Chlamydomonas schloesseri]